MGWLQNRFKGLSRISSFTYCLLVSSTFRQLPSLLPRSFDFRQPSSVEAVYAYPCSWNRRAAAVAFSYSQKCLLRRKAGLEKMCKVLYSFV